MAQPAPRRPFRALSSLLLASALLAACAPAARHSAHSAGELAARLANDRCQARYGVRPFAPSDFEAELVEGRWIWGGEDARPVDGFSAAVSFAPDGGTRRVEVNRHEHRGNPDGW